MTRALVAGIILVGIILIGLVAAESIMILSGSFLSVPQEEIRIGFIGPLSGYGAFLCEPSKNAALIAVDEINSQGGINGRSLEIILEDGKCDGKEATLAAQKLINVDGVSIILGGLCSAETLAVAPIAEANQIILFSPGSGSPDITNAGDYVFRNFPSDATSGRKIAEAAISQGYMRMALLSLNSVYAEAISRVFTERYTSLGGTITTHENVNNDAIDFRTQVTKMLASDPDAIYMAVDSETILLHTLNELSELGYEGPLFSNEIIGSDAFLSNYREQVEGAVFAEPAFDSEDPLARHVLGRYYSLYEEELSIPPIYLAAAYDAIYILAEAIESCGEVDTDCIRDYLYSIENRRGAAGFLTIDENGDPELEYVLKTIRNGDVVPYRN